MTGKMHHIALLPRDGLFCKDGRGWHTSASGRGHALDWPWPSTLRGALLTAWGREQETETGQIKSNDEWLDHKRKGDVRLGASLALYRPHGEPRWQQAHRVWPAPADALWLEGRDNVFRLLPQEPKIKTLGRDDDVAREALWVPSTPAKTKPRKAPQWLCEKEFVSWLSGTNISAAKSDNFIVSQKRVQAHVGIDEDSFTHKESILFSHDVLEMLAPRRKKRQPPLHEWAIAVQAELKSGDLPGLATLGSDGRLSRIDRALADDLFAPPEELLSAFEQKPSGLRLVVVTPARFKGGWLLDGFEAVDGEYIGHLSDLVGELPGMKEDEMKEEVILRAAFVPRPLHVSGWDVAKGRPKRSDRLVPPGAVYFFQRRNGGRFTRKEAEALWLAALGERQEEGFGRVVAGVWNINEKQESSS